MIGFTRLIAAAGTAEPVEPGHGLLLFILNHLTPAIAWLGEDRKRLIRLVLILLNRGSGLMFLQGKLNVWCSTISLRFTRPKLKGLLTHILCGGAPGVGRIMRLVKINVC